MKIQKAAEDYLEAMLMVKFNSYYYIKYFYQKLIDLYTLEIYFRFI